jgi:alpha-glucosidase
VRYYGARGDGAHLPFNFQLISKPWDARIIATTIDRYEAALPLGGWPNWVLGNHDRPRVATRVGRAQAPVAAMALLTLRGTPTMYYGDELGMENVHVPPDKLVDPQGIDVGIGEGRDPERTPMQWDASPNAGFTAASEPWLPIADDYRQTNVAAESDDPNSMLSLYRRLIELRRSEPALSVGSYTGVPADGDVLAYIRQHDDTRLLVALNLGGEPASLALGPLAGSIILTTHNDRTGEKVGDELQLRSNEGIITRLA